jgi:hypothetical protein
MDSEWIFFVRQKQLIPDSKRLQTNKTAMTTMENFASGGNALLFRLKGFGSGSDRSIVFVTGPEPIIPPPPLLWLLASHKSLSVFQGARKTALRW